jgi:hypothetical protein
MDNFGSNNFKDDALDKPIPFDDSDAGVKHDISHSPLDLGGGQGRMPQAQATQPVGKKPGEQASSAGRITGVKTFFTKLHGGAIEFLDEQITGWLQSNPNIVIKHTNTVTGELAGKKTEPNIIVTVWY